MSRIQQHFIYNTLAAIEQLCLEQPGTASKVIHDFSLYLRGNVCGMEDDALIPLSQEIEHIRHYAAVEQVRFPDISIRFELRTGEFLLPALTVQPLVENAIRHGMMGLESGGTVTVSTCETDTCYCVSVVDDGAGFDVSVPVDGKSHIGLRSVRERLKRICGGTLTVDSTPGKGTAAQIRIPKEDIQV